MKKARATLIVFASLTMGTLNAQVGSWTYLSGKYSLNDKWSAFGEIQMRSTKFYNSFHYFEYKAGLTYSFDKNFSLSGAAGQYKTFTQGGDFLDPVINDEFRIWQQLSLTQHHSRVKIEHRYRSEERFTSNGFKMRYRMRFNVLIPLNKPGIELGTIYFSASNEIFIVDRAPYFERDRVSALIGYQIAEHIGLQLGYLYQLDYKPDNETGIRFLQLGMQFDLRRHEHHVRLPGMHD
jgi:Protein of unknown function (DUF2490).